MEIKKTSIFEKILNYQEMGKVLYILGIIATIWCILDIFKKNNLELLWKIILCVAVVCTSWIGFAAYYFYIRKKI